MTPTHQEKAGWFKGKPENRPITQKIGDEGAGRALSPVFLHKESLGGKCRFWRAQV